MALTRITQGVIKPNENYDTHNINSTGIVTATGLNISGNASIGGVLTYEDVTNIDSIGIITAREGIRIGAGKSIGSDGAAAVYYGDGSNLSGISQVGGNTGVDFNDNVKVRFGSSNDFEIFHDGNETKLKATGSGNITILAETPAGQPGREIRLRNDTGVFGFGMDGNGELVPASNGSNGIGSPTKKFYRALVDSFIGDNADIDDFISVGSNIHLGNAGIITATSFSGSGSGLTGITITSDAQENTVGGTNAGNSLTSNSVSNTFFGSQSGRIVDTGDRNIAIGRYTLYTATSSSDNVAIGYNSLYATTSNNNTAIGSYAGRNISSGADNTIIGKSAGDQLTTSSHNVIVGSDSGKGANQSTASRNVIIGYQAIQNQDNPSDQVAIGYRAMANQKDDAYGNVAVGSYALECSTNQEVYNNTCIGMNAGRTAENGFGQSVFVGYSAGEYVNAPDYCTGIGYLSMRGTNSNKLTGYHNTGLGYRSLTLVQGAGEKNTALGSEAGDTITTGSNNICIGYNTQVSSATVTNEVTIGDANITKFRIPGLSISIDSNGISDANGNLRSLPQNNTTGTYTLVAADAGKHVRATGQITIPSGTFSTGDMITIYNNSSSAITIVQGSSTTVYNSNDASTGNKSLKPRGLCTILCESNNAFVASGNFA